MRCAAGEIGKDEVMAFFRSQLKAVAASKRKKSPGRKRGEDRRR